MGQTLKIETGSDVVSFIKTQHAQIKMLFEQIDDALGAERERSFQELRRLLAVHETAEEEVIHPAARRIVRGGEPIVAQRLREENDMKRQLAALEKQDVGSAEFARQLAVLQQNVVAHIELEERDELATFGDALGRDRLVRMRKAVQLAETFAPTHPHAGLESAAANLIVGPFAAMVDRARDAFAKRN